MPRISRLLAKEAPVVGNVLLERVVYVHNVGVVDPIPSQMVHIDPSATLVSENLEGSLLCRPEVVVEVLQARG